MMAPDGMALAATALRAGVSCLVVTLGSRGAVYFAAPSFETLADLPRRERTRSAGDGRGSHGASSGPPIVEAPRRLAIQQDAATCGARPISPEWSPVISCEAAMERNARCGSQRGAPGGNGTRTIPPRRAQPDVTDVITVPERLDGRDVRAGDGSGGRLPAGREGAHRRTSHTLGVAVRTHGAAHAGADARRAAGFAAPDNERRRRTGRARGFFRHAEESVRPARHGAAGARRRVERAARDHPVVKSEDVHEVVDRIQQKAQEILAKEMQTRRRRSGASR